MIAKEAGLSLELPEATRARFDTRVTETLQGTLAELLVNYARRDNVIIEPTRIRLVGRREALAFWQDWWRSEREK